MSKKLFALLAVVLIASMLLVACAPAATPAPAATTASTEATKAPAAAGGEKTFKLGVMAPYTGAAALTGQEFRGAVEMAFEAINYKIGDYKVELVWVDEQSDPAKTVQAYEQAIVQDKIQACILNWHSSDAVSAMDVAAKYKLPHFFAYGATELVNEKYHSDAKYGVWFGKGWSSPKLLSIAYVVTLEDAIAAGEYKPAAKTVYIYGEDTDWGRSFGGAIKGQFKDAGWEIVGEDYFAADQTEFTPLLNKIKNMNPAVVAGTSTAAPVMSAFIKQAEEVGVKSLIVADGLGWFGEWYNLMGDSSNYVLDQIPQLGTDKAKKFAVDFKAKYNIEASPSAAGHAYDWTNFFIKIANRAIEATGELTTASLMKIGTEELMTGKLTYTDGIIHAKYQFTPESSPDPVTGKGAYIFPVLQYMGGKSTIVWPAEQATGKLQVKPE